MPVRTPFSGPQFAALWAALLLLGLCGTAPVGADDAPVPPAPPPLVTTALSYTDAAGGGQAVAVTLNGVSADFLFDTGTNISCVSQALVTRLSLTPRPAIGLDGLHLTVAGQPAQAADVDLRFGDFITHQTPLVIFDEAAWEGVAGRHLDGVLGSNVLTVFPALLDIQAHRVTFLSRSPVGPAELAGLGMAGAIAVPVQDQGSDFLFRCQARFGSGGREAGANLLADSGSTLTLLPAEAAGRLGLRPVKERVHTNTTPFGGIRAQTGDATLTPLGGVALPEPLTLRVDWPTGKLPKGFGGAGLGLDVFSRYRVLFDFHAKIMYLAPLAPPEK